MNVPFQPDRPRIGSMAGSQFATRIVANSGRLRFVTRCVTNSPDHLPSPRVPKSRRTNCRRHQILRTPSAEFSACPFADIFPTAPGASAEHAKRQTLSGESTGKKLQTVWTIRKSADAVCAIGSPVGALRLRFQEAQRAVRARLREDT